jgi:HEPN domain-containing protein
MDEAKRELVRHWLTIALDDLASARKLASEPDAHLNTAVFHCQQAAEKAVKAFLVFCDQPFEKIHDIAKLMNQAAGMEPRLQTLLSRVAPLTRYVAQFRYPSVEIAASEEEFEEALQAAQQLFNFVLSLLPKEVQP